jgi:hypothetical protein
MKIGGKKTPAEITAQGANVEPHSANTDNELHDWLVWQPAKRKAIAKEAGRLPSGEINSELPSFLPHLW